MARLMVSTRRQARESRARIDRANFPGNSEFCSEDRTAGRDHGKPGDANKCDRYNEIASSTTITFRGRSLVGLIKHFVPASEQGHSRSR
ncbi:hypothetical protein XI09_29595 [Bradyrhizobium sp. CCBAU 11386]|uniref:hypothetical protein n=1 Tax=Bradyrhizobium sp. CCBAU 11386 TaxID=1630837 RepID=UPI002303CA05|nr:hypothetical protein [Bradyrhizobium sp. CCBAU 11386]MDA9508718.1 hypothetical protein [Bradyrhizobium sp. CCBAU 11386]